jgi:PAS domain S-box-containing protein
MTSRLTRIKSFLAPPVFPDDQDKTRTARVLNTLLLAMMLFLIFAGAIVVPFVFVEKLYNGLVTLAFFLAVAAARWLMQRGRVRLASLMVVATIWIIFTVFLLFAGGMTSIAAVFYVTGTVMAGLLLGTRAALINALACILAGLVMVILESSGHFPPRLFPVPALVGWVDLTLSLLLTTAVLSLVLGSLKDALALARRQAEERKKAEEVQRRERDLLDRITETSPAGITVVNRQGIITFANAQAERVLGLTRDEITQRTHNAPEWRITDYDGNPFPDEHLPFQRVLDTGQPVRDVRHAIEWPDGRQVLLSINAAPLLDETGGTDGIVAIIEDVTEQAQAEKALQESRARLQSIFRAAPVGIGLVSNRRLLRVNDRICEMLGRTRDELVGKSARVLYASDEDYEYVGREKYVQIRERGTGTVETHWQRKDGEILDILLSSTPLDTTDLSAGVTFTALDITERKRAGEALQISEIRFRSLIEQTTDAVFCYEYDPPIPTDLPLEEQVERFYQGVLVECNDVCARAYGATHADEVTGRKLTDLFGTVPSSLDNFFRTFIRNGYRVVDEEGTEVLEDGTRRYYLNNGHGVVENGEHVRVWGTFRDITNRKRAESQREAALEALRQSEELFRMLFEHAPIGMAITDLEGHYRRVNQALCRTLGYTEEELLSLNIGQVTPAEDLPANMALRSQALRGDRSSFDLEKRFIAKSGEIVHALLQVTLVRDAQGQPVHFVGQVVDITERKRAEEAQRRHAQQLEALRQVGLEIAAELNLTDLLHSIVSRAIELLEGTSGGLYLYRPEQEVLEWVVAVGPGVASLGTILQRGEGLSGKVWERGEPLTVSNYQAWPGRSERYEGYPIQSVVGVPVRWGEEFLGVLDVLADAPRAFSPADTELLTLFAAQAAIAVKNAQLFEAERERRQEAEALRRASLALGSTLDSGQVLSQLAEQVRQVVPYDCANVMQIEDGVARIVHQWGYDQVGTTEAVATLRLPVNDFPYLREMLMTRRPCVIPDTWADPDWVRLEPIHWIRSWIATPIVLADQVIGVLSLDSSTPGFYHSEHAHLLAAFAAHAAAAIHNATLYEDLQERMAELQQAQSQLVQSAKMAAIGELSAGVAHELNNPLTSVLGFAELLLRDRDQDDATTENLSIIVHEAHRARDIVRNLLDFSRQTESFQRKADINEALGETLNLLRRQLRINHIELKEDFAQNLPLLPLAVGRIKQVFLNLITNALYAMPQGGTLTVSSRQVADEVAVRFADTGMGIPAQKLERIFEPFFTTKPVGQGTGLGLSVSLGIVQEHGGRITVESQVDEGSTFTVWFPVDTTMEVQSGR